MNEVAAAAADLRPLLRVALVEPEGGDALAARLQSALAAHLAGEPFVFGDEVPLAAAITRARDGEVDALLLPVGADGSGLVTLLTLRAEAPTVPVVVLCTAEGEPVAIKAAQLGAAEYLVLERLFPAVVSRSLRYVVEVERVRGALARHHADWPPSLADQEVPAAGAAASLQAVFPERFAALVTEYGALLDSAVEHALQRSRVVLEPRAQAFAEAVADLRAGPRDVVELHTAAMRQREHDHGAHRMQLYVAEGRVRLLEVMGKLAALYRDRWLQAARHPGR